MSGPIQIPYVVGPVDPAEARASLNSVIEQVNANYPGVVTITGTAHTLAVVEVGNFLEFTNSAASTLTIPLNVVSGGTTTKILDKVTSGGVTIAVSSGVTLISLSSHSATAGSGSVAELDGVGGNVVFFGGQTA